MFIHFHHLPTNQKTESLHRLCTTATLRVNKCRTECSQPIGVVMNNRRSECEHGKCRLCTSGNNTDFTILFHLYEYARLCPISKPFEFTKQKILEMQDLLLYGVEFFCIQLADIQKIIKHNRTERYTQEFFVV